MFRLNTCSSLALPTAVDQVFLAFVGQIEVLKYRTVFCEDTTTEQSTFCTLFIFDSYHFADPSGPSLWWYVCQPL